MPGWPVAAVAQPYFYRHGPSACCEQSASPRKSPHLSQHTGSMMRGAVTTMRPPRPANRSNGNARCGAWRTSAGALDTWANGEVSSDRAWHSAETATPAQDLPSVCPMRRWTGPYGMPSWANGPAPAACSQSARPRRSANRPRPVLPERPPTGPPCLSGREPCSSGRVHACFLCAGALTVLESPPPCSASRSARRAKPCGELPVVFPRRARLSKTSVLCRAPSPGQLTPGADEVKPC